MSQLQTVGSHKTTVVIDDGELEVTYHGTCVVKVNPGRIVLDSGGWQTQTTKARMNQASNQYNLGFSVFQKDYAWYVDYNGDTLEFVDGMVLTR